MKFFGALVLFVSLCTAYGIRCYTCTLAQEKSCTNTMNCPAPFDRCFTLEVQGLVTKGCQNRIACIGGISCCEGNLCNGAVPSGPSVILLLVSSAIITLFL